MGPPRVLLVEMEIGTVTVGNSMEIPQKIKTSTPSHLSKENKNNN